MPRSKSARGSADRAQRGVRRDRMVIDGRGEAEPIADNKTESGRAENRRVEWLIRAVKT